jgi:FkbM family methyltransferase
MGKVSRTLGFIFAHPLAKRHPFKSFFRFLIWQVQSSLSPQKLFIKPFVGQVKFYARKKLTGITGNVYAGLHEFGDMAFLLHFLREGDFFLDVGANVGSYSLLSSGVCKARTIAFEPIPSTFNILASNVTLNKLGNLVTTINSAVGAAKGTLIFISDSDTTNHVLEDGAKAENTVKVPVITIDESLDGHEPSLIKIDVEGYETEALKGMAKTLDTPSLKAIIIELNGSGARYGYDEEAIHQLLKSKGFKPYSYDPFNRKLEVIEERGDMNTIYCRDIEFVDKKLESAPKIKVMGEAI